MKKIIFAVFVVLCMAITSCQMEYPTEMGINGGHVTVDGMPVQRFTAPTLVRVDNNIQGSSGSLNLVHSFVPDALRYVYYVKVPTLGQIRLLSNVSSPTITPGDENNYRVTVLKSIIANAIEWGTPYSGAPLLIGVSAISFDSVPSNIVWCDFLY